jgi:predicted  nucleic acid-binding Zn-ribbon protein
MACMEHCCTKPGCNFSTFNNDARSPSTCPQCGSEVQHHFDEELEPEYDEDEGGGRRRRFARSPRSR